MPTYTPNLNLKKPFRGAELIDVNIINENMDIIDEAVGNLEDRNTTITPITTSGTKIAEFEIDGARGALYAPQGQGGGSNVVIEPTLQSGEKIADYTIDGVQGALYIPEPTGHLTDEVYAYDDDHFRAGYGNFDEVTASELNCDTGYFDSIYVDNDELVPVEANPSDTATDTLTSISIDGTVYGISGGGGGSSVTPNPQGTPTDTLNTIGIDGTIFDIAGSGGGSGSAYTETLLYENTGTSAGDITLSDDLSNYDMLMFVVVRTIGVGRELVELPYMTSDLTIGTHITLISYASEYINYDVTSMTLLTRTNSQSNYVEKVKGIKFGGGAEGGLEKTLLWDYVTDNNNIIPFGSYTASLNDDINNYDMLVIESMSSRGDSTDSNWASTNLWYVDVNALNNNWNNNYVTYTSWNERATKFHIINTTFEALNNNGSDTNGLIRVYGLKWAGGGSGTSSEIIPISAGDGTTSRTFTFEKPPKFIAYYWNDPLLDSGWNTTAEFVWGQEYIVYNSATNAVSINNNYQGCIRATYSLDEKSVTFIGGNAFAACNTSNGTGIMYVDYGGAGGSGGSSGGARKDVLYNNPSGAPTATYLALTHDFRDYDEIYMKISNSTDISSFNIYNHVSFMPMMVGTGERVSIQALYGQRVVDVIFDGATFNVIRVDGDYHNTVYEIVGIKY